MLVLTRKVGEQINIGDGITIRVLKLAHGRVKLGLVAPAETAIVRAELVPDDDAENREAHIYTNGGLLT